MHVKLFKHDQTGIMHLLEKAKQFRRFVRSERISPYCFTVFARKQHTIAVRAKHKYLVILSVGFEKVQWPLNYKHKAD